MKRYTMRVFFVYILFVIVSLWQTTAQDSMSIWQVWESEYSDYLDLSNKDTAWFNLPGGNYVARYFLEKNDSVFVFHRYKNREFWPESKVDRLTFKVLLVKDTLRLTPMDKYSRRQIEKRKSYRNCYYDKELDSVICSKDKSYDFTRKKIHYDNSLNFRRIYFRSTICNGECPVQELEISRNGKIRYKGDFYTEPYVGKFVGRLTKNQLERLNSIIRSSNIDSVPSTNIPIDAPTYTLVMTSNKKRKDFYGVEYFPINHHLFYFLKNGYKVFDLEPKKNIILLHHRKSKRNHKSLWYHKVARRLHIYWFY